MRRRAYLTKRNVVGVLVLSVVLFGSGVGYVAPALSDLGDALTGANTPADAVDDSGVVEETGSTDPGEASADGTGNSNGDAPDESGRGSDPAELSDGTIDAESNSDNGDDVGIDDDADDVGADDAADESNRSDRGRDTDRDRGDRNDGDESNDPGLVVTGETNAGAA